VGCKPGLKSEGVTDGERGESTDKEDDLTMSRATGGESPKTL